jgi:kinetochore protein Spc7/SPC105
MRGRLSIGDDMTVDMDITEIVARSGTLRPTGSPASTVSARSDDEDADDDDEDDEDEDSEDEDEVKDGGPDERTMDFTVAVGGIIPGLPPVNAWRNVESIGYSAELPDGYDPSAGHTMGSIFSSTSVSSPLRTDSVGNNPFGTSSTADDAGRVFTLPVMVSTGDESVEMDETVAMGGIVTREDQTISSVDDDELPHREPTLSFARNDDVTTFSVFGGSENAVDVEEEMDFTIARGGILDRQTSPLENVFAMNVTSPSVPTTSLRAGTSSRRSTMQVSPPRELEPTASSSRRERYGPSPSPPRSVEGVREDDPVGRNIEVAKEVAKKLVFTPSKTVSPKRVSPAKRSFENELQSDEGAKSRRTTGTLLDKENVAPVVPIQTPASPVKNTSTVSERPRTPSKRLSEFGAPQRSPHKHLAPRSPARMTPSSRTNRPTTPSRLAQIETVAEPEWAQQEFSNISLGNFLEMTGIHFMTSGPTATRRKSVLNGGMPAEYMQRMTQSDVGEYLAGKRKLHDGFTHVQVRVYR